MRMVLGGGWHPASPSAIWRNVLARLFVLVGGIIVLALTVALVGPYFIDWTSYRADFEREASRILGRNVTVAGDASARILPFPSVTFTDVKVEGETPDAPSMTVETFSMDAELAPFMRGEFLIFDMRLHKPAMVIDVADNGLIDWTIRPNTPFDASEVTLEKISVTDGSIAIRHAAGGRDHTLDRINVDISARTLAGPWRINGSLAFDGSPMRVTLSTGTVSIEDGMRLRLTANPQDVPVALETDGNVRIADGGAVYSGLFRLKEADRNEDNSDQDSAFSISIENEEQPVVPFRVSGQFTADHRLIEIDDFLFETGTEADPYTAEGNAFFDLGTIPRFSIQVAGQQVRFGDSGQSDGSQPLAQRMAAFRDMMESLPRPRIQGTVSVDLPAIVAGDTTIRQVKLLAQPDENGWSIDRFAAELPGRATLEAEGLLATGSGFGFHGTLLLAVNQPSGFAAWLSEDVDEAIRRLPAAGFSARVDINAERQTFRDMELILGGARFKGEIDHILHADARPSMLLRLDGGALDVDGLAAFASIFINDSGAARFDDHDLDFAIKAGPVSAGGLTAGSVDTALRLKNGLLDIDRLSISDVAGATVSATGKLKNFPDSPTGNLDASVVSVDLQPLAALLAARYPDNLLTTGLAKRAEDFPGLLTETRIDMVASAAANDDGSIGLAVSAHGLSGGSRFTVSGSGTSHSSGFDGPLSVTFTMQNDDAAPIFAAYGLQSAPLGLTGPAESSLTIAGEAGGLFETKLLLRGGESQATFNGWTGIVDGDWQATGKSAIRTNDAEPWLVTAGFSLPNFGGGLPLDIEAEIDHGGEVLKIVGLAGTVTGNPVEADLTADFADTKPAFSGSLSLPTLDISMLGDMLVGEGGLQVDDEGMPAGTPFAPAADFPFAANVELKTDRLEIGLANPLRKASLKLAVDADSVRMSGVDADYRSGHLSGLAEIQNNGGTALVSTQFQYGNANLADLTATETVAGKASVSVSLTANGKSLAGLVSSLSGSGTITVGDTVLPGANPDIFAAVIDTADTFGKDIDAGDVAGFAGEMVASSPYPAGDAEFAFVLAGGVMRTPAIVFEGEKASLETELKIDFNRWDAVAEAEITYDPGREALVGAVPAVRIVSSGRIGSMAAVYDTAPMAQFLTQRALEIEQLRVESLQAGLLEKQRLRREVRYYASLEQARDAEEEARRQAEQEALEARESEPATETEASTDPAAEKLEDAVRRILDEEAKRRADEEARVIDDGERRAAVTVNPEPRPNIDDASGEDNAETGGELPSAAFEQLREDGMTIDNFLRSIDP